MTLDPLLIGTRIRKIREEEYNETRTDFANRCGLTETHIGQIERGEILLSTNALNKIITSTGVNANYILYGNTNSKKSATRVYIDNYLDSSDPDELKYFLNFIATSKKLLKKEVDKQVASILDKKRS